MEHKKQWEFLTEKADNGRLSHAYILAGEEGSGKKEFVNRFLSHIQCVFPDVLTVKPAAGKEEIEIAQIRDIQNFLQYAPYHGKYKAVVVEGAERMNEQSQNCFLKTLEEPSGKAIIFLISSKPEMLLSTIHSRCQQIKFFKQPGKRDEEIEKELLGVFGADLAEKFSYAKEADAEGKDVLKILASIERYARGKLLEGLGAGTPKGGKQYSVASLQKMLSVIDNARKTLLFTNASSRLALEIVLMEI